MHTIDISKIKGVFLLLTWIEYYILSVFISTLPVRVLFKGVKGRNLPVKEEGDEQNISRDKH